jgi:hypothetical protein
MSEQIDSMIAGLDDWRGPLVSRLRTLVGDADPGLKEEWKWGTAVWTSDGNVCAAGAFKDHVKLNFFKGASLADPAHLFNGGLDAKDSRSIDFQQGDEPRGGALQELVRSAVAFNREAKRKPKK